MSSAKVKADVIDADAHVVQTERVLNHLERAERHREV